MAKEPRGKERLRQWYAARFSADTAGSARAQQQTAKPETAQPEVRGADKIRQMYNRPEGDDSA